jgi:hypothetical protein
VTFLITIATQNTQNDNPSSYYAVITVLLQVTLSIVPVMLIELADLMDERQERC